MKKDFASALGIVMRASRKNSKLTLVEVAQKMGYFVDQVRAMESGAFVPHTMDVEDFARAVGTTEVDILQRAWATHDLMASIQPMKMVKS